MDSFSSFLGGAILFLLAPVWWLGCLIEAAVAVPNFVIGVLGTRLAAIKRRGIEQT